MVYITMFFFFQAEDGIRDVAVTGVQTCALPIFGLFLGKIYKGSHFMQERYEVRPGLWLASFSQYDFDGRSEEHTSELQSRLHLVCRLLLEKKKKKNNIKTLMNKTIYLQ